MTGAAGMERATAAASVNAVERRPAATPAVERPPRAAAAAALYRLLVVTLREPDAELVRALEAGELGAEVRTGLQGLAADTPAGKASRASSEAPREGDRGGALPGPQGRARTRAVVTAWEQAAVAAAEVEPCRLLEDLQAEHARLFTGPGRTGVPAYESQLREPPRADGRGALGGAVADAVLAAYREHGVGLVGRGREQPDYFLTEIEFLRVLTVRMAAAERAGDVVDVTRLAAAAARFRSEHTGQWLPALAALIGRATDQPSYRAAALLLSAVSGAD
jgi:TorA maturation chaperone TorD